MLKNNETDDHLFENKTNNFKIILKKMVDSLIDIHEDESMDSLYNCIIIGEELIKQFDIIYQKFLSYKDKKSPTKMKNLENKIALLNKNLNESDKTISELEKKYIEEKHNNENLEKKIKELNLSLIENKKLITELEENLIKERAEIKQEENKNLSIDYINKLNDANEKVLKQKKEKIKELGSELDKNYKIILNYENDNKQLRERVYELEKDNNELNTKINTKINEQTQSISLAEEIIISKQKEEIIHLNKKINELTKQNNFLKINKTDLNKPLLENDNITHFKNIEDTRHTCSFCCMM